MLRSRNGSVRCINPIDDRTIWSREKFVYDNNPILVQDQQNKRSDLVCTNSGQFDSTAAFYDSETGQTRFTIDSPKMDGIRYIELDKQAPDRFVYVLAGASSRATFTSPPQRDQGFLLSKVDRVAGQVVWWQECYQGMTSRPHLRPSALIQVDINNDQVTDLITGSIKNGHLSIKAIDGRQGEALWEVPLQLEVDVWRWEEPWPMMILIPSGDLERLLVVDSVENDEKMYEIKSIKFRMERYLINFAEKRDLGYGTTSLPRNFR